MRKKRFSRTAFPLFLLTILFFIPNLPADPTWTGLRENEVVIVPADSLPQLLDSEIAQVFAFSYSRGTNSWRQIPFQIDEKGPEIVQNFYDSTRIDTLINYFGELNDTLDTGEEISFLVKDAGDQAPDNRWISNLRSRDYPRYEIKVTDPLHAMDTGFVYLYKSNSLAPDPALTDYVLLTQPINDTTANDIIYGQSYIEGHDLNGFTTDWLIPFAAQGTNTDILDFLKMRLKVDFGFIVKILEIDALKFRKLDYIDGNIRVIRRLNYFLDFALFTEPVGIADFTAYYYPYHTDVRGPSKRLDEEWGVSYLRQSFDLNVNGVGMTFSNPYNHNILIDGQDDEPIDRTLLDPPNTNWHLISGQHGSVLFRYPVPDIGVTRELYYLDSETETSADGFGRDSGDGKSYGDVGIAVTGERMAGSLGMSYEALFLAPNQNPEIGPQYVNLKENPLAVEFRSTAFDKIPPAAITDLQVTDFTQRSITLGWTAPGDDGNSGGPVSRYEIKYSELAVLDELEEWLIFAKTTKTTPEPKEPGTHQTFTVKGLKPNQTYYFFIRSQDDMGNWSGYSNVASGTAFPVEMAIFEAKFEEKHVRLKWRTVSETNNHGFEIEKQTDADADWDVVGFVPGSGTTNTPQSYTFLDKNSVLGTTRYRLKQIDRDGSFKYSEIVTINIEGPKRFKLSQNYPNPFNPATRIAFQVPVKNADDSGNITIRIFDLLGNLVRSFEYKGLAPGYYELTWDGTNKQGDSVAAGIYYYQLRSAKTVINRKMTLLP